MYLTNKALLKAIHESKKTYCSFARDEYGDFDVIVQDRQEITPTLLAERRAKLKRDLVIRLMTDEHIPLDPERRLKGAKKLHKFPVRAKTNFPSFIHLLHDGVELREVGRSHWIGSLSNGEFSVDHGQITREFGMMLMLLVERYSKRANYVNYSYIDEMRGAALVQLTQVALQFNEAKSSNPFAFYTTTMKNSFTRVLNLEKRAQRIRDDLIVDMGQRPSYTRQLEGELARH